ncbi:SDR family oxidoreductase [Arthrobacter sp. zg-Y40]|uniref:SDR family NAD(P)-dependent oxidoreductase n=1 Tax=Arthrobacter sp. zg-Y40 TaxID=2886939 RepID=UPI001D141B79|nr:SDR family oxidoreductase [Arthrobacter sp. zg-Y40]MCC3278401.1 SDR family oxidoreductase [Arthrobacter sp. zg-Y40]
MQFENTTALITGASSGIGAEFARQLARRGADVVLVGRREDALTAVAAEITADTGRKAHAVPFDLGVDRAGILLKERLDDLGITVDTVVNCAGVGLTKAFAESSEQEIHMQLQVNAEVPLGITRAFLPDLLAAGRGVLVNVGSMTGYMPVPGMGVYAAAKAFLIRFTVALAHEVRGSGVVVMVLSPGPTRSGFYARSGTSTDGARFQTPEQVVRTALKALDRRRPPVSVIAGRSNRVVRRLVDFLPVRTVLRLAESRPAA